MGNTAGTVIWVLLLGFLAFLCIKTLLGKQKYKNMDDSVDPDWIEKSLELYPEDFETHQYYFTYDHHMAQGYQLQNRNKEVVYECKLWYLNVAGIDDVDFINHINGYTSHHKVGHVQDRMNGEIVLRSSFSFDGEDVLSYVASRGYTHRLEIDGLAFTIYLYKDDVHVATLYSSNNGKNFFDADGPIVPQPTRSCFVIETMHKYLDEVILYTMFFARCKFGAEEISQQGGRL